MRTWTRWQDWIAVIAGLYAALSPLWTTGTGAATGSLIVLGALIVIAALLNLALPRQRWLEWVEAVLGLLLFLSPWVLGFTDSTGAGWTAWITGGVTIVVGVWAAVSAPGSDQRRSANATNPPVTH